MNDLTIIDGEPRVDSRLIAENLGVKHKNTIELIQKNVSKFEALGILPFKTEIIGRGQPQKYILLNEDQSIFLLSLSRNTERVIELKFKLTKEFGYYRNQENNRLKHAKKQVNIEWKQAREEGRITRHELTDSLKQLVSFAESNGSKNAARYYKTFTQMIYSLMFGLKKVPKNFRDSLDHSTLRQLELFEMQAARWVNQLITNCENYHAVYPEVKDKCMALIDIIGKPNPGLRLLN